MLLWFQPGMPDMSGGFAPIHVVPEGMPVHTVGFGMRGIMLNRPPTYEVSARWCCVVRWCIYCPVWCLNLSGHSLHWSCYLRIDCPVWHLTGHCLRSTCLLVTYLLLCWCLHLCGHLHHSTCSRYNQSSRSWIQFVNVRTSGVWISDFHCRFIITWDQWTTVS